jgi:hypothetical protein
MRADLLQSPTHIEFNSKKTQQLISIDEKNKRKASPIDKNAVFSVEIHRSPYDTSLKEAILRQKKRMQLAKRSEMRAQYGRSYNTIASGVGANLIHGGTLKPRPTLEANSPLEQYSLSSYKPRIRKEGETSKHNI